MGREPLLPPFVREKCVEMAETVLAGEPAVRIFLFGSRAAGSAIPRSDVDLGIDVGHTLAPDVLERLREAFDDLPILQKVDLVDFAAADPGFKRAALETIAVLYERKAA